MRSEPTPSTEPGRYELLGVPISAVDLPRAVAHVVELTRRPGAAYVCVRDVNGVMACQSDAALLAIHRNAALVTPDGMPVVWWGRRQGLPVDRVYGPDLMRALCAHRREPPLRHFLCGGEDGVAQLLARSLEGAFPGIDIVGTHTPPFRPLDDAERRALADEITRSGADIIWIGLSSPKQERFMAELAPLLPRGVMIGVGAAFDFLSGRKPQAPRWIQRSGFEWLFRLVTEPRRLWRRYLVNNSLFLWLLAREALGLRPGGASPSSGLG